MSTFDRLLRIIVLIGIFLVPLVPLVVSTSMFFPYITGKNFVFRILVLISALSWALLAVRNRQFRPSRSPLFIAVTVFVVMVGLSNLLGVYPYKSFWSNYERMEGYIGILHVFAYFVVLVSLFNKERLWGWLIHSSLAVSVLLAIHGFFQMGGYFVSGQGGTRLDVTFGNATYFAIYASLHAFFALFLLVRARGGWQKFAYSAIAILNLVMLYHTATRGAILGFLAGILVAGFLSGVSLPGRPRKLAFGAVFAVLFLVAVFLGIRKTSFVQNSEVLNRFANISLTERTTTSRFTIWGMAYEGWKERPLLGWGQENFNYVFNKYYKTELWQQEAWFDRAHNFYAEWFVAGGLLGGLSYLSIFVVLIYLLWKGKPGDKGGEPVFREWSLAEKSLFTGAIVAYAINNFFVFDNLVSAVLFFSLLAAAHLHHCGKKRENGIATYPALDPRRLAGSIVVVFLAVFVFWQADVKPIRASRTLIKAMTPQGEKGVPENYKLFKEALAYETFAAPEAREQFVRFATQVAGTGGVPNELKMKIVNDAEEEMREQVRETPDDARYRLFLGNYYIAMGRQGDAISELKEAVRLSPGKQQMYYALSAAYINNGQYEEALKTSSYAYDLDTSNNEALKNYAVAAIFAKDDKLSNELIAKLSNPDERISDNRFFQAYYLTKRYDMILRIWEDRVAKDPKDAQKYTSLAAAYLLVGRRTDAVKTIEKAIALEPKFKEQGTFLINEIRAGRNPVGQ